MTATQFIQQFTEGVRALHADGVIDDNYYEMLMYGTRPSLERMLATALFDEAEYYADDESEHERDVEYDFHALDDAKFERIELGYEEVWSSQ